MSQQQHHDTLVGTSRMRNRDDATKKAIRVIDPRGHGVMESQPAPASPPDDGNDTRVGGLVV